jgi:pSer/pThr/pTyr-binding forkhead associated (FHA) protein
VPHFAPSILLKRLSAQRGRQNVSELNAEQISACYNLPTLTAMPEATIQSDTALEILAPDKSRQRVNLTESPFYIGRGGESDNHLQLADGRISRKCAALVAEGAGYRLEDRGNRYGLFVNGARVERHKLRDGDVITFGVEGCYEVVFRTKAPPQSRAQADVANLLTRIGTLSDFVGASAPVGLGKLNLLLEATSLHCAAS